MSFGQQLKVRRECSSGIGRPYSAETVRTHWRVSSPATSASRAASRLPARPHSSCDVVRDPMHPAVPNEELLAQLKTGCNALPSVNSSNPNSSDNNTATPLRSVKRRYLNNFAAGYNNTNNTSEPVVLPTMSHFDIRLQTDETKLDHIRMYYCDFLAPTSIDPLINGDECTIEVEKLCEWLTNVAPRTRFDAYPLWVLTKDMLRRFLSKELFLFRGEAKQQEEQLQSMHESIQKLSEEMKGKEAEFEAKKQQAATLSTISDEMQIWKDKAEALEAERHKTNTEVERLIRELEEARSQGTKLLEVKALEIKSKVESSWKNQIDAMQSQAEKAAAEAENEKNARNRLQTQVEEIQAELVAAHQHIQDQALHEARLVQMMQDSTKIDINRIQALLPVIPPEDLLKLLKELLVDKRLAGHFERQDMQNSAESANLEEDLYKADIKSFLRSVAGDDSKQNKKQFDQLSREAQWRLFHSLVSANLEESNNTALEKNDDTESEVGLNALLPTLLQLVIKPPKTPILQQLFSLFGDGEQFESVDEQELPALPLVHEAEHVTTVMKQIEDLTSQYEKTNAENAELQAQIAALRGELQEALVKLAAAASEVKTNEGVTNEGVTSSKMQASESAGDPTSPMTADQIALEAITFKPTVLRAYIIDDRILKGKQAKALPVATVLSLIANSLEAKARADSIDDRKGNKRQNFPEFLRDFFLNKYGVKSMSYFNFKSFVMGIEQNLALSPEKFAENLKKQTKAGIVTDPADIQKRLRIFGTVSGLYFQADWNEQLADFVLCALGRLFTVESIKESLEPKDQKGLLCIDTASGVEAGKDAWAQCTRRPDLYPAVEEKLLHSAEVTMNLALYEWMDILVQEWLALSTQINGELINLFKEHDADGNGSMDLEEFRSLIKGASGIEDEKDVSHIFGEALTETAANALNNQDPDAMRPEAFVYVARKYGLLLPSLQKAPLATP